MDVAADAACPPSLYAPEDDGGCGACPAPWQGPFLGTYAWAYFAEALAMLICLLVSLCK